MGKSGHQPFGVLLGALLLATTPLHAQGTSGSTPREKADGKTPPKTWEERLSDPVYMSWALEDSTVKCIECHLSPSLGQALRGDKDDGFGTFSRRVEMERWLTTDKHTIARRRVEPFNVSDAPAQLMEMKRRLDSQSDRAIKNLRDAGLRIDAIQVGLAEVPQDWIGQSNVLSRRICDKLWGDGHVTTPNGYLKFRDNCLTCHGGYESGKSGFDSADLNQSQLGIDCNYCHQLGDNTEWVDVHDNPEKWRLKSPAEKAGQGLRHLVDTSNQASLCFDCHIGNRDKSMFVTHEMYAAGHPPIPSIELQEFCKEMPQHWQTPSQLYKSLEKYKDRDKYFAINYPGLTQSGAANAGSVFWNTRKMLIGALAARAKALDLYIASAGVDGHWADYSLYDCAACHHELQTDSYRQQRYLLESNAGWNPGRPRENEWPDALLTIGLKFLAYASGNSSGAAQIQTSQNELTRLFSAEPFGRPEQVGPTALQMRDQIKAAIDVVERAPVTEQIARQMLIGLSRTNRDRLLTYDSARQVVWAMQTIAAELRSEGHPLDAATEALIAGLGKPEITGLEAAIPSGRGQFIFRESLEADLERRSDFEPGRLLSQLAQINGKIAGLSRQDRGLVSRSAR